MANRYERSQVIDYKPYLPPVEMYAKALEMKQQKFDAYRGVAEEMGSKYIDGLQQDSPRARQIESELQAKIDAEVAKVGGDYSKLAPALYKLKRDVNKMFGAGGEAYAIAQNKKNLMEAEKLEQARYKKGDIRADQLSAWRQHTLSGYKGVGEFDATTGQYNQLSPESIAKNVDGYKLGEEVASKMKAKGFEKEIDQVSGDWVYRNKVSGETLTPKEIMDASYGRMVNDSGYMDMLRQEAEWTGQDFNDAYVLGRSKNALMSLGSTYDVADISTSQTMKTNSVGQFNKAEAGRNRRHGESMEAEFGGGFDMSGFYSRNIQERPFTPISFDTPLSEIDRQITSLNRESSGYHNDFVENKFNPTSVATIKKNKQRVALLKQQKKAIQEDWSVEKLIDQDVFGADKTVLKKIVADFPASDYSTNKQRTVSFMNAYNGYMAKKSQSQMYINRLGKKETAAIRESLFDEGNLEILSRVDVITPQGKRHTNVSISEAKDILGIPKNDVENPDQLSKRMGVNGDMIDNKGEYGLVLTDKVSSGHIIVKDSDARVDLKSSPYRALHSFQDNAGLDRSPEVPISRMPAPIISVIGNSNDPRFIEVEDGQPYVKDGVTIQTREKNNYKEGIYDLEYWITNKDGDVMKLPMDKGQMRDLTLENSVIRRVRNNYKEPTFGKSSKSPF